MSKVKRNRPELLQAEFEDQQKRTAKRAHRLVEKRVRKTATTKKGKPAKKAEEEEVDEGDETPLYGVRKDAAQAIRQMRLDAKKSESDVADAMGADLTEYINWESGVLKSGLQINDTAIENLAKLFKQKPSAIAAQIISGPAEENPEDTAPTQDVKPGDQTTPPTDNPGTQKSDKIKKTAGSGQVRFIKTTKSEDDPVIEDKVTKAENRRKLFKGILGLDGADEQKVRKGLITPDMFAPNNTLNPELGTSLINLLQDQSQFLKKIQIRQMRSTMQEVLVWDVVGRKARKYDAGVWPSAADLSTGLNKSLSMAASKMNLQFMIDDETIAHYQGNLPGLEQEVFNGFSTAFLNEVLDIAFNSTTDTYNSGAADPALTLGVGWLALAAANVPAGQIIDISDAETATPGSMNTIQKQLNALIAAAAGTNKRFFTQTTPIVMGTEDWDTYEAELLGRADAMSVIVNGAETKYRGRPVELVNFIDTQNAIRTELQNFVLGIVTGQGPNGIKIERLRVPEATLFRATIYRDMAFVNYDAVCVLKP